MPSSGPHTELLKHQDLSQWNISVDFVVLVEIFRRRGVINLLLLFWFPCFCSHQQPCNSSIWALQPVYCSQCTAVHCCAILQSGAMQCSAPITAIQCNAIQCTYSLQYSAMQCTYPTFTYLTSFMCSSQCCGTVRPPCHAMPCHGAHARSPRHATPWPCHGDRHHDIMPSSHDSLLSYHDVILSWWHVIMTVELL